jgi:hypothetical protein
LKSLYGGIGGIMFRITGKKGFHITFGNGYTVSVQFGPTNYCDNYDMRIGDNEEAGKRGSTTAECAVWGPNEEMIDYLGSGDTVSPYLSPEEVLKLMNWAAKQNAN